MDLLDRLRLDHPVAQAGMGGGVAGADLAGAVAAAGALGTLGLLPAARIGPAVTAVRERAPGRCVAVNLLMPFTTRAHVRACAEAKVDAAVLFFASPRGVVEALHAAGTFVLVQVGTSEEARAALTAGADGLIAQGAEAGGHLLGRGPALGLLGTVLSLAEGRPVLVAGGIADAADVRAALDAGAAAAVAGTRFLMTPESRAHPAYRQRVAEATATVETTLFGVAWPARHRVVPNAATERWCHPDGRPKRLPGLVNQASRVLGLGSVSAPLADRLAPALLRRQRPGLPAFTPSPPLAGMPVEVVDAAPLYAGETALRIRDVIPAAEAVRRLAGGRR